MTLSTAEAAMPAPEETVYLVTPGFMHWIEKVRPGVASFIRQNALKELMLRRDGARFRLRFVGLSDKDIQPADKMSFDRQIDTDEPAAVLDGSHPDEFCKVFDMALAGGFREVTRTRFDELVKEGKSLEVFFPNSPKTVKGREGYLVEFTDGSNLDIDTIGLATPLFIREVKE